MTEKYLKFTYVDAQTGISIATEPARNGPKFPDVAGLEFVWARESAYPTAVPEFFGTCPDDSDTDIEGVLAEFVEADWLQMQVDEMRARNPVPVQVTMRQARLALLAAGLLDSVTTAISAMTEPEKSAATIEWEYATEVRRDNALLATLSTELNLTTEQLDQLFITAASL